MLAAGVAVLAYLTIAYVVTPALWHRYDARRIGLGRLPGFTYTGSGIPGDPLNVALIGSESQLRRIMDKAKWTSATPLGLRADVDIAVDSVLRRPDPNAPVSRLYLFGRVEDLAFEQEVDGSPRHRHHVRLWKSTSDAEARPVWVGAAIYDRGVGFSRTTGQITHRIAERIDDEREYLFQCLRATGALASWYAVDGFHKVREGKNGSGDPWSTDGRLFVGVIEQQADVPAPTR